MTAVQEAEANLVEARAAVVAWGVDVKEKRATMAQALVFFQALFPVISRENLVRDFIKSEQKQKLALARGEIPPAQRPRVANSYLDRLGAASARGDADDQIRKQLVTGHRRGAYPSSMRGRYVGPVK